MSNGWDWIEEGLRIAEEARQAGELDVEAIKAASLVYGSEADELTLCRAGHCAAAYKENAIGGEARGVVAAIAKAVGVELSSAFIRPLDGNVWSPRNMERVVQGVRELVSENEALREGHAHRDQKQTVTVKALHEALAHLGESV